VSTAPSVGFVGLGAMGTPMVEALLDGGFPVIVFDVRTEAAEALAERGATAASSVAEVADGAETVLVSLPTPDVVRGVADEVAASGGAIRTFVDLSTTGPSVTEAVAAGLADRGIRYLDAPVSGGVAGVRARRLTVMAAGDEVVFADVRPMLATFAATILRVGVAPGQGQLAKLLNNLLSASAFAITSEAITFGVSAGLDPGTLLDVFNASSGRNTATSDKFPQQVLTRAFDSGFRLQLMAKDVELCLAESRIRRHPMPVGALVQQLWTLAAAHADDGADHTEFVKLAEEWAGVEVVGTGEVTRAGR
jgi:3-hydroxyisobutyrate dehydrogenase-like beta-hydroxyacid dehydrogenase